MLHVAGLSLWLVACRGCGCSGVWLGLVIKGSGRYLPILKMSNVVVVFKTIVTLHITYCGLWYFGFITILSKHMFCTVHYLGKVK